MENLEKRISVLSLVKRGIGISAISIGLALGYGCAEDPSNPPSKYCCEAMKCGEEGNPPVCAGEGDECYCREKTCCEELSCGGVTYECVDGATGGCICQRVNNTDNYEPYTGSDDYLN